jgi:hypothetical protein
MRPLPLPHLGFHSRYALRAPQAEVRDIFRREDEDLFISQIGP